MFSTLSEKLESAFRKFKNKGKLSEADVREGMREVKQALFEADVNFKVVNEFVKTVTERAVGAEVLESLLPAQHIIKIVNEELTALMGGENSKLQLSNRPPTVVIMAGLQGAGKTTHVGKLAGMYKKQGRRPLLVACDIYRPAAVDQLRVLGEKIDCPVFFLEDTSPVKITKAALAHAEKHGHDMVFIDTAGRLHVDGEMMEEIIAIKKQCDPTEILFVVDAMTGQDAVNSAKAFDEALDITGVILTKLDSDTRGGAALAIRHVTGKPIKFIGTGEKLDAIEPFHPDRMASRILGMGDMLSLIEKAEAAFDDKKAEEMEQKLRKQSFNFSDYLDMFEQLKSMGSLQDVMAMMGGQVAALKDAQVDERQIERCKAIILSMTMREREKPDLLNASRKRRIAAGSGVHVSEVNRLIKQVEQMGKMMKQVSGMTGLKGVMVNKQLKKMGIRR